MIEIFEIHNDNEFPKDLNREKFVDFLFEYLDRFGDPKPAINKCIDYAFSKEEGKGGFCLAAYEGEELMGALVMNKTGMSEYIPENILVYVCVHSDARGKGIGGKICKKSFEVADGDVKLHVEYDNPAKRLYERLGMTNKYAEMRYTKNK